MKSLLKTTALTVALVVAAASTGAFAADDINTPNSDSAVSADAGAKAPAKAHHVKKAAKHTAKHKKAAAKKEEKKDTTTTAQ